MTKPAPQRQQQPPQKANRSPKSRPAAAQNRSPKPAPAEAQAPTSEAETLRKVQQPISGPSPDKQARGRQQASRPAKDKTTRRTPSPSLPSLAQGRRNNVRQPSPPVQPTSQAEDIPFANTNKSNLFDPFIVPSSDSESDSNAPRSTVAPLKMAAPVRATPKLANPSGKLARRRQPAAPGTPTPAPSRAVPVPRAPANNRGHGRTHSAMMNMSRSAPIDSPVTNHNSTFPICDDMTDADGLTPPATPTKGTWQQTLLGYDDGPRTAPLSSTFGYPFNAGMSSPNSSPSAYRQKHHVRSPSEGVFNMSFDEDSSSSDASEELKMLFGLMPKRPGQGQSLRGMVHSANSNPNSSASKAAKAALYASSLFQNSPSPDELPPPAF